MTVYVVRSIDNISFIKISIQRKIDSDLTRVSAVLLYCKYFQFRIVKCVLVGDILVTAEHSFFFRISIR